jgi:membrane protease YdiL (CAAX protease family)
MDTVEELRWKRVWRHPLVVLVVATLLVVFVIFALGALFERAPAAVRDVWGGAVPALVGVAALFALYKLVLRKLGDRVHDDLPLASALKGLALGIGGGGLLIAVVVGLAALFGVYRIVGWEMGEDFAMILFQGGIFAGFAEELLFRGILFRWLEEFGGSWAALAITSLFFGLGHGGNDGATAYSTIAIMFEAGILFGAAYMYTRSLWVPIGIHFGWNFIQGFVFDVPVSGHPVEGMIEARLSGPEWLSGGAFGLEASVIALVVCTAAGAWLLLKAVRGGQLMAPRWRRIHRAN